MNGIQHFQTLAKYNIRLNQQVLVAASSLSHDQINEDRGAFFKSILGTLNHILVGDLLWLRRFHIHDTSRFSHLNKLQQYPNIKSLDQILFEEINQRKAAHFEVDAIISDWINKQLSEQDLESRFSYQNIKGIASSKNFAEVLSHIFNHQTNHRGQASTLLSQTGVDIRVTDYLMDMKEY